jgi:hypothetical protein
MVLLFAPVVREGHYREAWEWFAQAGTGGGELLEMRGDALQEESARRPVITPRTIAVRTQEALRPGWRYKMCFEDLVEPLPQSVICEVLKHAWGHEV